MTQQKTNTALTKEDLENFEKEVAEVFATGSIRAPVHLRAGREEQLIKIFKDNAGANIKVTKAKFKGDTHEGPWEVEAEGKII